MLATESRRCLAKSCGRLLDLQESSYNTHTPLHSAGPIDADREGRVEERRDGWLRQTQRETEREEGGGFKHADLCCCCPWATEHGGQLAPGEKILALLCHINIHSDSESRMTQVVSGGCQKLHKRTKKKGFAFKTIASSTRPDPVVT